MADPAPGPRRSAPRIGKWILPGVGGLVLAGGIVAILVAFDVGGIRGSAPPGPPVRNEPATVVTTAPKVPLEPEARRVAGTFILSAVARRDLAKSYPLAAPSLRGSLTLKQWETGNIPVVPYPALDVKPVRMNVTSSTANQASLRVFLDPRPGVKVAAQVFIMNLEKIDGKWLVTAWVPYNAIAIPQDTND